MLWYERGVDLNNADAMLNFALLLQTQGEKGHVDELLKKSAKLGSAEAIKILVQNNLISSLD